MGDVIDMKPAKTTLKDRWEDFKVKARVKTQVAWDWCKEHKEVLMVVVPAVIGAVGEVGKAAIKAKDHREERELEELRLRSQYDRSLGAYVETTHPLTTEEKLLVQETKRAKSMTTIEALNDLGLLNT